MVGRLCTLEYRQGLTLSFLKVLCIIDTLIRLVLMGVGSLLWPYFLQILLLLLLFAQCLKYSELVSNVLSYFLENYIAAGSVVDSSSFSVLWC